MLDEVRKYIQRQTAIRAEILRGLTAEQRKHLIAVLIRDFFAEQRLLLLKWATLTGQSAQIDTGYVAQHMASVCLGIPGQGFKGKGLDLVDGSEVKSAAILGGVDRPRWNHNMGTLAQDAERARKGLPPTWAGYLGAPGLFYVLFDRIVWAESTRSQPTLRVRAWYVDAQRDAAWRDLVTRYISDRAGNRYNLQLHPPVGYDDNIVVNTMGNLDFENVKVLEVCFVIPDTAGQTIELDWILDPLDPASLPVGSTRARPYGGRGERPSRLEGAAALQASDQVHLDTLFPGSGLDETLGAYDPTTPDPGASDSDDDD